MNKLPIKTKLAIFDIDGTLTDSVAIHQSAFCQALKNANLTSYDDNFSGYLHHTDRYIVNTIYSKQNGRDMTHEELSKFENALHILIIQQLQNIHFHEILGAIDFVDYLLWNSPYAVAYATGSFFKPALYKLSTGFPNYQGSILFSCSSQPVRKEIVLNAIKASQQIYQVSSFEEIIAFGDGIWDWKTADHLGIEFIGIGTRSYEVFMNYPCRGVFSDFVELQKIF